MFRWGARIASPINLAWPQLRLAAVLRERGEQQALAGLLANKIRARARPFPQSRACCNNYMEARRRRGSCDHKRQVQLMAAVAARHAVACYDARGISGQHVAACCCVLRRARSLAAALGLRRKTSALALVNARVLMFQDSVPQH